MKRHVLWSLFQILSGGNRLYLLQLLVDRMKKDRRNPALDISKVIVWLYVEEEVHDVAVLNNIFLSFDSELSCGPAGCF